MASTEVMSSPRDVLGVAECADADTIRAAYKRRALETHPDKGGDIEKFRKVQLAYELLSRGEVATPENPTRRGAGARAEARASASTPSSSSQQTSQSARRSAALARANATPPPTAREKKSFSQEINQAFSSMPASSGGEPGSDASRRKQAASMPASELWEKLSAMTAANRERTITTLPAHVRADLNAFLKARRTSRSSSDAASAAKRAPRRPAAGSAADGRPRPRGRCDSASSSSSSSSGSNSSAEGEGAGAAGAAAAAARLAALEKAAAKRRAARPPSKAGAKSKAASSIAGQSSPKRRAGKAVAKACPDAGPAGLSLSGWSARLVAASPATRLRLLKALPDSFREALRQHVRELQRVAEAVK